MSDRPPPPFGLVAAGAIGAEHQLGDRVLHRNDEPDDTPGTVTGYQIRADALLYLVTWGRDDERPHYGFELIAAGVSP